MLKVGDKITFKYKYFGKQPDIILTREIISGKRNGLSGKYIALESPLYTAICRGNSVGIMHFRVSKDYAIPYILERISIETKTLEVKPMKTNKRKTKKHNSRVKRQNLRKLYKLRQKITPITKDAKYRKNPSGKFWFKVVVWYGNQESKSYYTLATNEHQARKVVKVRIIKDNIIDGEIKNTLIVNIKTDKEKSFFFKGQSIIIPKVYNKTLYKKQPAKISKREHAHSLCQTHNCVESFTHKAVCIRSTKTGKVFRIPQGKADKYTTKWFEFIPKSQWKKQQGLDRIERKKQAEKNRNEQMKLYQGGRVLRRVTDGKRNIKITYSSMQHIPIEVKAHKRTILNNKPTFEPWYKGFKIEKEVFNIVTNQSMKRILWAGHKSAVYIDGQRYVRTGWDTVKKIVEFPDTVKYKTIFHNIVDTNKVVELSKSDTRKIAMSMNIIKGKPGYGDLIVKQIEKQKLKRQKIDKIMNKIRGLTQ